MQHEEIYRIYSGILFYDIQYIITSNHPKQHIFTRNVKIKEERDGTLIKSHVTKL